LILRTLIHGSLYPALQRLEEQGWIRPSGAFRMPAWNRMPTNI